MAKVKKTPSYFQPVTLELTAEEVEALTTKLKPADIVLNLKKDLKTGISKDDMKVILYELWDTIIDELEK